MGIPGTVGVDGRHRESGHVGKHPAHADQAAVGPEAHDDIAVTCECLGRRRGFGLTGHQPRLAQIAADPGGPRLRDGPDGGVDVAHQRPRIDQHHVVRANRPEPSRDRPPVGGLQQPVPRHVHQVALGEADARQRVVRQARLGAEHRHEGALAVALGQCDVVSRVGVGRRRLKHPDAFGGERRTHPVAEWPGAVRSPVGGRQALTGGGDHGVEAAAGGRSRRTAEHVAAALGQGGNVDREIDDDVADADQRHADITAGPGARSSSRP